LSLGALVATHGYWIVAAGCLLEGETVLLDPASIAAIAAVVAWRLSAFLKRRAAR
jgi:hypothetical protein